jgi:hypothetical protein
MIQKQLARDLLMLVNDVSTMSVLEKYVKFRIEKQRDVLEQSENPQARGALIELRRFLKLRDEVIQDSK